MQPHAILGWADTLAYKAPDIESHNQDSPIHNLQEPHTPFNKWRPNQAAGSVKKDRVLLGYSYERLSLNAAYLAKSSRFTELPDEDKEGMVVKRALRYDVIEEREVACR